MSSRKPYAHSGTTRCTNDYRTTTQAASWWGSLRADMEMHMPAELSFSLKQARRLALAAQGFSGRQPPATVKSPQLNRLIERLGILQIDSVNALVRSHYLPLYSRLGRYSSDLLDQAAWCQGRRRTLFEYWGHDVSLLPLSLYPLMRWRMQRARQGEGIRSEERRVGKGCR